MNSRPKVSRYRVMNYVQTTYVYEVDASSEDEAIEIALDGMHTPVDTETQDIETLCEPVTQ